MAKEQLCERFIVPPFSVLDGRQAYWRTRKAAWREMIGAMDTGSTKPIYHPITRGDRVVNPGGGISMFDPVLTEVLVHWFTPRGGELLDPFAGQAVRGVVSAAMGRRYTGIDLRTAQVEDNRRIARRLKLDGCRWIVGDSGDMDEFLPQRTLYDGVLTCPPYFNLERYLAGPNDLSEQPSYPAFLDRYSAILGRCVDRLKPGRFFIMVVGEIRDPKGRLRDFVGDSIDILRAAGMSYYNDLVAIRPTATAPLRAAGHMRNRKVVRIHDTALVFFSGDPRRIDREAFPELTAYEDPLNRFYRGVSEVPKRR